MNSLAQYILNWLQLVDQAINVMLGGDPRQTISARMGRNIALGRCRLCRPICALLALIQRDHCAKSWQSEQAAYNADQQTTGV